MRFHPRARQVFEEMIRKLYSLKKTHIFILHIYFALARIDRRANSTVCVQAITSEKSCCMWRWRVPHCISKMNIKLHDSFLLLDYFAI